MGVTAIRRVIALALALSTSAATEIVRAAEDPVAGDFVGQVPDLYRGAVAISTDGHRVLAYVCDGTSTRVTVARWFAGAASDNTISLSAGKAKLDVQLDADRASGTVTLDDGRSFKFRAVSLADPAGDAGLFRSELDSGGHHYVAGWIEEPSREELQPTQLAFLEGWFDWSEIRAPGGLLDEFQSLQTAPAIGPTTTRVPSSIGELEVHRVRQSRMR
jgi:hypothetical protein